MHTLIAESDEMLEMKTKNKALLDKLAIEREQKRLEDENRDLQSIVKQASQPDITSHQYNPVQRNNKGVKGCRRLAFSPRTRNILFLRPPKVEYGQ